MRIAMIGTGYVGLVSGACLADFGHHVTCVDQDMAKIAALEAGIMPIWEPGLEALVKANVAQKRLDFTTDLAAGIAGAELVRFADSAHLPTMENPGAVVEAMRGWLGR